MKKKARCKKKVTRRGRAPGAADAAKLTGARAAGMPREFSPQLATLAAEAPRGEQWLHELKFDGYRMLAFLRDGKAAARHSPRQRLDAPLSFDRRGARVAAG